MHNQDSSLSKWLVRLESVSPREIDLGLERMHAMISRLSLDTDSKALLVAGTNGKGSSVSIANVLLRATGFSVGCYTSPHLLRFNERIVINDVEASDDVIVAAFERIEAVRGELPLTYFEYSTLAALVLFADAELDVWLLEIGLGGRLDACNAVMPRGSLIASIALDHCDWLGDTIAEIAEEKAGIMRQQVPTVFSSEDRPAAIENVAAKVGAQLIRAGVEFQHSVASDGSWNWHFGDSRYDDLQPLALAGEVQLDNASGVLALLHSVGLADNLSSEVINGVLPTLTIAGRSQSIKAMDRDWYFDVAHNPAAALQLVNNLAALPTRGKRVGIVGLLDDKDVAGIIDALRHHIDVWVAITPSSNRAIPAAELARMIANQVQSACLVADNHAHAMEFALHMTKESDKIVVCGSFFTVGPLLSWLQRKESQVP